MFSFTIAPPELCELSLARYHCPLLTLLVSVLDLSTSSTSPLELQEPYISYVTHCTVWLNFSHGLSVSAITYDPITQLLIVATPTKISTHATALDPSAPVPALELQGQWGTTAMGIQPAIALDNGGFVAFAPGCDVASLHIGDALSWTDSAGPTRAKGQPLRALTGDGGESHLLVLCDAAA